jgi:hypothetical protein
MVTAYVQHCFSMQGRWRSEQVLDDNDGDEYGGTRHMPTFFLPHRWTHVSCARHGTEEA